jgi:catechol 2,3-dioxygenase-like lactoylglutathione lyase family enzyme
VTALAPAIIRSMPVLQVADVQASEAFYTDVLGFSSHGIWGDPPAFCIVQRGDVTLALDRALDGSVPLNQYWAAYLYVTEVDALCAELKAKGAEIAREIEDTEYGCRDFDIRDPDGHLIAFGEDLNPGKGDRPGLG